MKTAELLIDSFCSPSVAQRIRREPTYPNTVTPPSPSDFTRAGPRFATKNPAIMQEAAGEVEAERQRAVDRRAEQSAEHQRAHDGQPDGRQDQDGEPAKGRGEHVARPEAVAPARARLIFVPRPRISSAVIGQRSSG